MGELALSLSMFPVLLGIPVLQMTLVLALDLFLVPGLVLAVALALAMALVLAVALVKALFLILALILVLLQSVTLALVQAMAMTLSSVPSLFQVLEIPGQTWSLIMPPGIIAMESLRNNPGNLCKSQNLVPEGYGSPLRLKGNVKFSVKHCPGASAFSTTGRKRYRALTCPLFLKVAPTSMGEAVVYDEGGHQQGYHGHSTWGPQRATNHLDQVPSMQGCSEGFFFRHGHQGLLTLQRQPSTTLSTTHKDSYQPPGKQCQPIRGVKRE